MEEVREIWLAIRSLLWTLLIPVMFAGYVPWRYFGLGQVELDLTNLRHLVGLVCIAIGALLLAACIWEFARSGRGTSLQFLLTGSRGLLVYWAIWFLGANLFVLGYEEPTLRRRFGPAYQRYVENVGRWLPKFR
jgi:protein-S-isoprenylcysteine O-methyltransferase Ste14